MREYELQVPEPEPEEILGVTDTFAPMPMLNVSVDFNDLLDSTTEEKAYEIIGKLKDLLS